MTSLIFSAVSLEKLKQCLSLRYVYAVLYYGISIVLLFSGVSKIIDSTPMVETIKAVFKVDENLLKITATFLPMIEIVLGLMLLLKIQTKKVLLAAAILFSGFFVFSIYGTAIDLNVDCGCFGSTLKSEFGWGMVMRNTFLLFLSVLVVRKRN
ncbi:MAG: methylamine utilization protein [Bacteroidetes bacterium]|nr:methylamine utilization protein [Bacteroidota bacterium]